MYAVIFRAGTGRLDRRYAEMAAHLRQLARERYGCLEFVSVTEGRREIAISYWEDLAQIERWRNDAEHQVAQALGRTTWYREYQVQVVEIIREYRYQEH